MVTAICPMITLSPQDYDAVLFDLDGVLTKTASVHAAAWKSLFDEFLKQRASGLGEPFLPFDIDTDYRRYVDGKPRYDGAASFLQSRGIDLPRGTPGDGPDVQSIQALGDLKDHYFLQFLKQQGVEAYEAVDRAGANASGAADQDRRRVLQQQLRGGAGGSRYCAIVRRAGGRDRSRPSRARSGKPAPDAFLEAARRLGGRTGARGHRGGRDCRDRGGARGQISAASSASITAGNRRRCARLAPMSW